MAVILSLLLRSSIANLSKPVPFVALKKATTAGKKIWGRKRHILVDTQGNVLAVKVTAASQSDQLGGKRMLEPLVGLFPRIKLVWGDSHYAGDMILWLLQHLGWLDYDHSASSGLLLRSRDGRSGDGEGGECILFRFPPASQKMGR
jgi:Transposase DDE domain